MINRRVYVAKATQANVEAAMADLGLVANVAAKWMACSLPLPATTHRSSLMPWIGPASHTDALLLGIGRRRAPKVTASDRQGAHDMVRSLISLGHQRIGFIRGPREQRAAYERFMGFSDALQQAGIDLIDSLAHPGDDHFETAVNQAHSILPASQPPTAIFAKNDKMA